MTYEFSTYLLGDSTVDHYIIRRFKDEDGSYWKLQAVFKDCLGLCQNIMSADSFEEIQLWCDLHNVKVKTVHK